MGTKKQKTKDFIQFILDAERNLKLLKDFLSLDNEDKVKSFLEAKYPDAKDYYKEIHKAKLNVLGIYIPRVGEPECSKGY